MSLAYTDNVHRTSLPSVDITLPDIDDFEGLQRKEQQAYSYPSSRAQYSHSFGYILELSGRWLLASDCIALTLAFICGGLIAWATGVHQLTSFSAGIRIIFSLDTLVQFLVFMGLGGVALLVLDMRGHYRHRLPYWESVGHILMVAFLGSVLCGFLEFVARASFSRVWLGLSWALFAIFLFVGRVLVRRSLDKIGKWRIPAIMVGEGRSAQAALRAIKREPNMGFTIIKQISPESLSHMVKPNAWRRMLITHESAHIFLALEGHELNQQKEALKTLMRERLPCSIIPPWMGLPCGTLSTHNFMMHDVLMMHDTNRLTLPLPCFLKRGFDIMCSGLAILLLSPVFLIVAAQVRRDGGPAFFMQSRVGRYGKNFKCYKFRTMRIDAEDYLKGYLANNPEAAAEWHKYQKLKSDVRITKFGAVIRSLSIDELPQLFNVFKGDMSLVGPRPIMPQQKEFYGDDFIYYESVRPGITGPWQVSGRNQLTFPERVKLECSYARNWSLWMDIVILLKTPSALLEDGQAF